MGHTAHPYSQGSFPVLLMTILNYPESLQDRGSFVGTSWITGETQNGGVEGKTST